MLYETIKFISLWLYIKLNKYKLKPDIMSTILIGLGVGVSANVMFVLTTSSDYDGLRLLLAFVSGIILLALGALERK